MARKRILLSPSVSIILALAFAAGQAGRIAAQKHFALTIDNIMRGPELYGWEPQNVRWSSDSQRVYFTWKQASDNPESPRDTYFVYRDRGVPIKLSDEDAKLAPPARGVSTRDRLRTVVTRDGDLFLYDFTTDKVRQLTKTADPETNPHFTKDEKRVAFTRGGNLFTLALEGGLIEQLTEIEAPGANPPAKKDNTSQGFLEKQEKELIQAVRDRLRMKDAEDGRRKREHPRKPFTLEVRQ